MDSVKHGDPDAGDRSLTIVEPLNTIPEDNAYTKKTISFYLAFLALNISVFVVSLDATALSVAIPRITQDLHGTTLEAFWASLSFLLAVVITQPLYTGISEVLGRKAPFYTAYVLFFIGSVLFAVAKNMRVLIVSRVLQGLGGGGLDVLSEVILVDITTLKERPLYLGLFALPMAGGGICGPIIGAAFSEFVNWRWIGWMNLPLVATGVVLAYFFMHLRPVDGSYRSKLQRLDWSGMALFTTGCILFTLPLSWAGAMYPWTSWKTLLPFLIGSAVLVAFAVFERHPMEPLFPYRIFYNTTAVVTIIGATIHGVLMYSVMLFTPLFFQSVNSEAPFPSAISVLPASASIIGFSIISAVVIEVVRKYRWIIISNWVFSAAGVGLWALWTGSSARSLTAGLQILAGAGIGTHFTVLTIPMQANVKKVDDGGVAAGILVSFRLFGGLIGIAISTGVFNNVFERHIASIQTLPDELNNLTDIKEVIGFIPTLRLSQFDGEVLQQVIDVYQTSMKAVFLTLAAFGALGFLTSLLTKEITLENEDKGRQQFDGTEKP
ncbi:MFS general substrate transporter [Lophiostoma macrostomum CBS 122681]|uniref:MFS general substrate transporter n=1 Tax=Lophiostoma macrostomum CBS 122681 TaxID=1314788 RepID=A0A6A6SVL7_9PLEO|nr:MFS general substrate transporter [Lophiostoma macrostomum CBS 122681]